MARAASVECFEDGWVQLAPSDRPFTSHFGRMCNPGESVHIILVLHSITICITSTVDIQAVFISTGQSAVELKDLADFAILDLRGEGIGLSTVRSFSHLYPSIFCTAADFLLQLSNIY